MKTASPLIGRNIKGKSFPDFASMPKDYRALCCDVQLPRPLRSARDYRATLKVAEMMAGHDLTKDQDDYLDAITTFIEAWEAAHEPSPPPAPPVEVLRQLLESNGLSGANLARLLGISVSMASLLLREKRQLTTTHIAVLCRKFGIGPAAFLPMEKVGSETAG